MDVLYIVSKKRQDLYHSLIYNIVKRLIRQGSNMNYDDCIKKSIEYIECNLNNKIELDELADKAFLSKYHFHRVFHAVVGEPVAEYIRKRRLTEAANDLLNSEDKIVDIAFKYQFNSQEVFTKAFKRQYGICPREFRRNRNSIMMMKTTKKITSQLSMAA
jgi:AraC-type DNA-binding domain-containing proteins